MSSPRSTRSFPAAGTPILTGQALMVCGGLILGTLGIFLEESGASPVVATGGRSALGLVALTAFAAATGRLAMLRLESDARHLAALAGLLMAVNWTLFFAAITMTSIAVATMAFHVQPFLIMAWGALARRERIGRLRILAALVALAGLVLASGGVGRMEVAPPDGTLHAGDGMSGPVLGVLLALGGSVSYAAVTLIAQSRRDIPPLALAWWQCLTGTGLTIAALTVASLIGAGVVDPGPIGAHGAGPGPMASAPTAPAPIRIVWPQGLAAWAWLAGLGVIHTGLAYVLIYGGVARLPAGQIALLQFVYPVSAIVFEAIVYDRTMSGLQLFGVALMLGALGVCTVRPPVSTRRSAATVPRA